VVLHTLKLGNKTINLNLKSHAKQNIISKKNHQEISLLAAAIAMGVILYAGVAWNAQETAAPCIPGAKDWPQCLDEEAAQL
jgi:hypothetical protein